MCEIEGKGCVCERGGMGCVCEREGGGLGTRTTEAVQCMAKTPPLSAASGTSAQARSLPMTRISSLPMTRISSLPMTRIS